MPVAPDPDDDILSVMSPAARAADGNTAGSGDGSGKAVPASVPEPVDSSEVTGSVEPSANTPVQAAPAEALTNTAVAPEPIRSPLVKPAASKAAAGRKGGAGSFILIFLLVTAVAAGLVYGVIYYLSHRAVTGG